MSFFFEEDKSINTALEPQENFYTKKELPPEQPKLGGVEARAKGREEYFTAKEYLENYNASRRQFDTSKSEVSEYRNLDEAWSEITDIMNKKNIRFDNPMYDVDLYTTEFGLPADYLSRQDIVTKSLEIYIQAIYDGSLDKESYIKLTNQILASHDKKLIDTIIKSGANTIKTTKNMMPELKTYINNFVPEYDYINQYNFSQKNEYHNLMMVLKSYAIPYESLDWSLFIGKIGIIMNNEVKFYGE
jgi:hypothetical protein